MKACPFCAEEIQDAAVKCRFCLEDLTEDRAVMQKLAEDHGTTLYAIAKKHGIKRPTIYAWAQRPEKMKVEQVQLVARELGMTTAALTALLIGEKEK